MSNFEQWILNLIKNQWRCKFKMLKGCEIVGIPAFIKDEKITIYQLDEDFLKTNQLKTILIDDIKTIEMIENDLRKYI